MLTFWEDNAMDLTIRPDQPATIIACGVMRPEIEAVLAEAGSGPVRRTVFLEQGLHRTPKLMPELIRAEVDKVSTGPVILGYGLCANGLAGTIAPAGGLVMGRCHDCISHFLGSPAEYQRRFQARPGVYYLTRGWLAEGKDPYTILTEEYAPRFGRDRAEWAMGQELKHYTHFCLIDNGLNDMASARRQAALNADHFGLELEEVVVGLDFFRKLILGPWTGDEFIILQPGQSVQLDLFL